MDPKTRTFLIRGAQGLLGLFILGCLIGIIVLLTKNRSTTGTTNTETEGSWVTSNARITGAQSLLFYSTTASYALSGVMPELGLFLNTNKPFTVEFFVNFSSLDENTYWLFSCGSQSSNLSVASLGVASSKTRLYLSNSQGANLLGGIGAVGIDILSTGTFKHIGFCYDPSLQACTVFYDGKLQSITKASVSFGNQQATQFVLGSIMNNVTSAATKPSTATFLSNLRISNIVLYSGENGASYSIPSVPLKPLPSTFYINSFTGTISGEETMVSSSSFPIPSSLAAPSSTPLPSTSPSMASVLSILPSPSTGSLNVPVVSLVTTLNDPGPGCFQLGSSFGNSGSPQLLAAGTYRLIATGTARNLDPSSFLFPSCPTENPISCFTDTSPCSYIQVNQGNTILAKIYGNNSNTFSGTFTVPSGNSTPIMFYFQNTASTGYSLGGAQNGTLTVDIIPL